jgi:hypothetical protein
MILFLIFVDSGIHECFSIRCGRKSGLQVIYSHFSTSAGIFILENMCSLLVGGGFEQRERETTKGLQRNMIVQRQAELVAWRLDGVVKDEIDSKDDSQRRTGIFDAELKRKLRQLLNGQKRSLHIYFFVKRIKASTERFTSIHFSFGAGNHGR